MPAFDTALVIQYLVLAVAGLLAGFVNTLAGGGSLLTIPALMLLGLPAQVANATNRIGVLLQSIAAVRGFDQAGRVEWTAILGMAAPTLLGAFAGAQVAAHIPEAILKPILLGILILAAVTLVWKPNVVAPSDGTPPRTLRERPIAIPAFFALGAYGGFLQAAMGIPTLMLLGGLLRYDLVRANAVKVTLIGLLTVVALTVFVGEGQVAWAPGIFLGVFTMIGAHLAVRFAVKTDQKNLRKVLFVAVVASCVAALVKG